MALVSGSTVAVAAAALTGLAVTAGPAAASSVDDEQAFVQLINQLRTDRGLSPLVFDPELTTQAREWSDTMAATDTLAHSPDMAAGISAPWTVLGENVGVHSVGSVKELFQAFVSSPAHYANLIDGRFQYVGVGVTYGKGGKLWTTHRFMATANAPVPETSSAPKDDQPPVTVAADPVPAVPTTTAPEKTTTTTIKAPSAPAVPATKAPTGSSPASPTGPADVPTTTAPPADDDPGTPSTTTSVGSDSTRSDGSGPGATPGDAGNTGSADGQTLPTNGGSSPSAARDRAEMAELVQPDPDTIEDVLNELVLAGI